MKIASNLILPDECVTWKMGILGRTGTGKTNTAVVMAEHMIDRGFPFVIFDPQGDWWGLRSKYPIAILGGDHADVPLEPTGGKIAADFVISERIPVLLDLFAMGEGQMVEFAADFAKRLWTRNREALHVFLDEADLFAPQTGTKSLKKAVCLGAWQNVVRRGRTRGLGCTMITQRSAVLNKDLLTQADPLIVHRLTAPQDLAAIEFYLSFHGQSRAEIKAITAQVARLRIGEAFVISPGTLEIEPRKVAIFKRKSFDSSVTPKPGEKKQEPRALADVDLGALKEAMAETIERAKSDDPKELRKTIGELRRQLASKAPVADQTAIDRAVQIAAGKRDKYWTDLIAQRDRNLTTLRQRIGKIDSLCDLDGQFDLSAPEPPPIVSMPVKPAVSQAVHRERPAITAVPRAPAPTGDFTLKKAERSLLRACYWLGNETPTRQKVAFFSGYTIGGGSFNNGMGRLRTLGLVKGWSITESGATVAAADAGEKPCGPDLREWLRSKLNKAQNALLDVLIRAGGERVCNADLAEQSGYADGGGSFNNALGRLRSIEAAEGYEGEGGAKAADVFFDLIGGPT